MITPYLYFYTIFINKYCTMVISEKRFLLSSLKAIKRLIKNVRLRKNNVLQFRYTLMRNCWEDNPDERPSFQEIHDALNQLLTEDEEIDISHY